MRVNKWWQTFNLWVNCPFNIAHAAEQYHSCYAIVIMHYLLRWFCCPFPGPSTQQFCTSGVILRRSLLQYTWPCVNTAGKAFNSPVFLLIKNKQTNKHIWGTSECSRSMSAISNDLEELKNKFCAIASEVWNDLAKDSIVFLILCSLLVLLFVWSV